MSKNLPLRSPKSGETCYVSLFRRVGRKHPRYLPERGQIQKGADFFVSLLDMNTQWQASSKR